MEKEKKVIPLFTVHMPKEVDSPLLDVLHSGYIGQGKKVEEFEKMLGEYIGNKNVLTVNSGTSGLHLALRLANVGYGDEVITTAMTCLATNVVIISNGAKIVWADIDSETGLIDPLDIERKITSKTKAIMIVDWGGTPCDLEKIMSIGKKYNVKVIEDCAHSFGAKYKGRNVGTICDFSVFSFQAIKHITTVDGGALFCLNTDDYKRGKLLRWYGIDREGERKDYRCEENVIETGYKFHMNDINATIGISQMPHADDIVGKHKRNAKYYRDFLDKEYYKICASENSESSYWLFTILLPSEKERLEFMKFMTEKGIMVSQVHARNDLHTAFKDYVVNLPNVTKFVERQVSIPVHCKLTIDECKYIVGCCNEFARSKS